MALGPMRLILVFGMVSAMAMIILTITTGAGPDSQSASTAPAAVTTPIYQPQLWNVF
jgi:hypothetical protein